MKTEINWIKCSDELPKESRQYLTVNRIGFIAYMSFSVKHQMWNALDWEVVPEFPVDGITHWAVPNFPEGVEGYTTI